MPWEKRGLFYTPRNNGDWMVSHAQFPVVDPIDDDVLRIYFGTRSSKVQTVTTYIEVAAEDPARILYEHDRPVLGLGELGCFDDGGAMPSWLVEYGGLKYLYYVGWNAGVTVSYRNSIGLAVSDDGGRTFTRMYKGPIVDRTKEEPHFCSSPCVLFENGRWRMWYLNGVKWITMGGKSEPYNHLKYAESDDGIHWDRRGIVAIELDLPDEGGIARPSVIRENGLYKMWYSRRGASGYRDQSAQAYRIGYAESNCGVVWTRKDDRAGIDVSAEGWDAQMIEFPCVCEVHGRKHLFYNGNGFGRTGIGYAVWSDG